MLKTSFLASILAAILAACGVSAAQAADIDFTPLASAGVTAFAVPVLMALAAAVVNMIANGLASRKLISAQMSTALATNVDALLDKAINFGAAQTATYLGNHEMHANVDGWVASYAAKYAVDHAPKLAAQAGNIVEKIVSRLGASPAVGDLKAKVAAVTSPSSALSALPSILPTNLPAAISAIAAAV